MKEYVLNKCLSRFFFLDVFPYICSMLFSTFYFSNKVHFVFSHWDVTSSRWVCESIRQTVANCRETFAWYRKVLACIANSSRTGRQSFKHVILFLCDKNYRKTVAKSSHMSRTRRQPVADPSQTFANTSQGSFRDLHNATNMRHK